MSKIIFKLLLVFSLFFLFRVGVRAQCQCLNWENTPVCQPTDQYCPPPNSDIVCMPAGCYDQAVCTSNSCSTTCGPGYYACNRGCCAVGSSGGGSSGGTCGEPQYWGIDCPPGTQRGGTQLSKVCSRPSYCPGLGSAQTSGECCHWFNEPRVCGDWYDCPTPNNPTKMCRDCTEGTHECGWNYIETYNCVSICNSTAPSNLALTQGASSSTVQMTWNPGTGGTNQLLRVDQSKDEVLDGCPTPNACEVKATVSSSTNSYIVTGLTPNTTYWFLVLTNESGSCRPSIFRSFTTPANNTVSGRVYMDANNVCSTSTPWNSATYGSLTATLRGTAYSGSVGTDGRFSMMAGTNPSFQYMDLSGIPTGYICSTAAGCNSCPTLSSITSPSSTNYFYLTPRREAWWRVIGGSIYAEGNVRSELPRSTSELIITGAGGALGSLMQSTGTLDVGVGALSSAGYKATTEYKGKLMNYDYFAAHMGVTPNTVNDWAADTMNKPANNPSKVFYYINPSGSEASVSTPWTVAAGESYVIFVNGDLRIASDITVANGGFLAFVVNGSVRVSPAVTTISGLYVIDNTIITESNGGTDVAADFFGSVVAWGGVNFGRDLVASNITSAAERFTYRPDLLTNMPDSMKVFALKWEEVVPGTIGQ